MRRVNLITWDLIVKEFNLTDYKKGEIIYILSTENIWKENKFSSIGKTIFKQVIAR